MAYQQQKTVNIRYQDREYTCSVDLISLSRESDLGPTAVM
jgi:hypothetical protein